MPHSVEEAKPELTSLATDGASLPSLHQVPTKTISLPFPVSLIPQTERPLRMDLLWGRSGGWEFLHPPEARGQHHLSRW